MIIGLATELSEDGEELMIRAQWGAGVEASTALKVVADQMGDGTMVLRRGPDTYVLGKPDTRDMVGRVFHVSADEAGDLLDAIKALASDSARVAAVGDAVVVRDTIAGMAIIDELYEGLQGARGQWLIEVQFVELSKSAAQRVGVDWNLRGTAALGVDGIEGHWSLSDVISARLEATAELSAFREHVNVLTSVRLHCIEGEEAEFQVGDTIPVPSTRSVSDQGTVVQDFEDVDTGVLLRVGVRTEPDGRLRVSVNPEVSQVSGFVEDRPIRSRRRLQTGAVVEPGGTLIAGGFTHQRGSTRDDGVPGLLDNVSLNSREDDQTRIYIVVRVADPTQS